MQITLQTPRLVLRPWHEQDVEPLAHGLNDLSVARWLAFVPHPYATSDAEAWIARCRALAGVGGRPVAYEFAVVLRSQPAVVGGVSLSGIDWQAGTAGGGIWLAGAFQGKGYGREAFAAKIRFAFGGLGLSRLLNGFFEGNEASWRMQRELGYRRVGERAGRCLADGRHTVEHLTALLRDEWQDRDTCAA